MDTSDIPDRLELVVRPITDEERWAFRSDYVEFVWAEVVGPTAVLLARRLGALIEQEPFGAEIEVAELAEQLCVGPPRLDASFGRLVRQGLVSYSREHGVVGASGFARSVGGRSLAALSHRSAEIHGRLVAEEGGAGSWVERRAKPVERLGSSVAGRRSGSVLAFGGQSR
jgi:hypothetical protein